MQGKARDLGKSCKTDVGCGWSLSKEEEKIAKRLHALLEIAQKLLQNLF